MNLEIPAVANGKDWFLAEQHRQIDQRRVEKFRVKWKRLGRNG
jgi:hypothetical protein